MSTPGKALSALLLFLVLSSAAFAGRKFKSLEKKDNCVTIQVNDGKYILTPYSDKIIHITFLKKKGINKDFSFAGILSPGNVHYQVTETSDSIFVVTSGVAIRIGKKPFGISYYYKDKKLLTEVPNCKSLTSNFTITEYEVLYGGGARVLGMNRRGNRLQLYNRAHYGYETRSELMNYTLPLFLSSNRYAILFDNASAGYLDLDSRGNNTVTYETVSGTLNYYLIAGDDWYDLTNNYTILTGRQPLPPRWALGNFASRFGYHSQKEVEETISLFFDHLIPVEAAIIDIYWFGEGIFGTMGALEWHRDSFPEPQRMIANLAKKGVKTILVTEPFILTTSSRWEEAVSKKVLATNEKGEPYTYDFYFGNTGLIDIFNPQARHWFWNIYREFTLQGIEGWWGDLGEPEVHPAKLQHINGSADEVHNAYGHEWASLIYNGYKKDFPDRRPFILMRAGYAGSQRYGMIPWSGDVNRSWGGLVPQPELALQMGMQGLAYMHSDLGGFAGGDTIDNELYIRWLQYGVFQPIFRPHAQEHIPPEPVFQIDSTLQLAKNAIDLRYKLLPYNYTLAYENSRSGKPLMRPLFFDYPDNNHLLTYDSAYYWGDAFLVAPVKQPGIKEMKIYLPGNQHWYHFYTGETFMGGHYVTIPLSIHAIPVFVKGGSFIPMNTSLGNTSHYSLQEMELHYYADPLVPDAAYTLYDDDGITPNAEEKGLATHYIFNAQHNDSILQIKTSKKGKSDSINSILLTLHNSEKKPVSVTDPLGREMEFHYNQKDKTVTTRLLLNTTAECTIHYQ
ncbi:MAG: glycoside hydrolase family 31 protein [Bacteroidales bacterium]|nr:DUF4968 domain-containing protein [Bacteroidales bacterium]MDD3011211.1 glycoside hydrolase family 31 protein [Bacteroidales bacterium]MDD3961330.1 glycoside hydrolase family 31 protein [Bacteroidales bacterium]MDY0286501.1 glycoside hydrolase family 31 protein [Bacteroidales bacterium]HPE86714.1 glycoside hydrolase family 31 protein [Bacteroidales bacterium]